MRYITAEQYAKLADIPRGRMTARFLVFAGVIMEDHGKVLLTQNKASKYPGWGLPGGKVLWSELITDTVKREVLEETGLSIDLSGIVGIYQRETTTEDEEFIRVVFSAKKKNALKRKVTDPAIKSSTWFPIKDILDGQVPLHSQQLLKEIEFYNKGVTFPLDILSTYKW